MAKMFYTTEEAAQKLGTTEDGVGKIVRAGKLREFRDCDKIHYKVEDVDAMAGAHSPSGESTGEIILEPVEDSSVMLAAGSDVLSLDEVDADDTSAGTKAGKKKSKEDTVVSSVGISVFDDEELDEKVDPLAQTAVTDIGGLGIDGVGSGSGILDLTRESDDTSLGAELLDEIYADEESGTIEMGEDTRAGLDEAVTDDASAAPDEEIFEPTAAAGSVARTRTIVEYAPDAMSTALTALLVVAMFIMLFGGLGAAALVRGVAPSLLVVIYEQMAIFGGGAVGVAVVATVVAYMMAKRSS